MIQCRINHVADVENATGLRPKGASGSREIFLIISTVQFVLIVILVNGN